MRLAVFGSRTFNDYELLCSLIDKLLSKSHKVVGPQLIVSGGADGVDTLARRWAIENERGILEFIPLWDKHGKAAGVIRNKRIRQWATHGLAIWDGKSPGTADMIKNWEKKKPLRVFDFKGKLMKIGE